MPEGVYNDFLTAIGGREIVVRTNPITKTVQVSDGSFDLSAAARFGTTRASAMDVVNAALKQTSFKIFDKDAEGNAVVNQAATEEVLAKIAAVREAFSGNPEAGVEGWVWEDEARATMLEARYNASFNRLIPTVYDGSHLALPGLATTIIDGDGDIIPFDLRPHQKDAVWRVVQSGNTLLDHVVGAGKTFTMIAAGMEQKRLGLIQRPMFVVPNHMLEQFSREFYQAYPNAKILVATKDQMTKDRRKEFAARVAADRWDGIIITHDAFGRISMSPAAYEAYIKGEIDRYLTAIQAAVEEGGKKDKTVKELEKAKAKLEARLEAIINAERKDEGVTFEELGVDHLVVDEAHLFKNLRIPTRHTRVKGIGKSASQRAEDLFIKIQSIEQSKPGRSVLFATGTPISNSMSEMYVMQRYLQNDTLREYGVDEFDAWAATFGEVVTQMELAPNGRTFQETTSFSRFVNIPELVALYSKVADVRTAEMLNLPRPKLKGGTITVVEAEPSDREEAVIADLVKRAEQMKGKRVEKGGDNMLKIVSEGRKVAIDGRLLVAGATLNPDGKIAKAVDNIHRLWKTGKDPALAQIVFLDMGVPSARTAQGSALAAETKPETQMEDDEEAEADIESSILYATRFNLYEDIRERLVARGVPREQIAFIHEATDDVKKGALFKKVRSGEVRVLLGSTGKMGVGTNVQRKLIAMHHIDAPWKPAEVEQRDGRIIRQGNENPEVEIYRYVTRRSFDSFMWQTLERKAKFISQIKAGARGIRSAEDIDDPLPEAATLKAAASGDPRIMEHAELTKEVRDLENLERNHLRTIRTAAANLQAARSRLASLEENRTKLEADAASITDTAGDRFSVVLSFRAEPFTKREDAGIALRHWMNNAGRQVWSSTPTVWKLGDLAGLKMRAEVRRTADGLEVVPYMEGKGRYFTRSFLLLEDSDPLGLIARWERPPRDIPGMAEAAPAQIKNIKDEIARLTDQAVERPFPKAARLIEAKRRLVELAAALRPKDPNKTAEADAGPTQMGPDTDAQFSAAPTGWDSADTGPAPRLSAEELAEVGRIIGLVAGLPSFNTMDTIVVPAGSSGAAAWSKSAEPFRAAGFYLPHTDAITVALDITNGRRVAYHESFHRLQTRFLTDKEKAALANGHKAMRALIASRLRSQVDVNGMADREVEAEAFAIWSTEKDRSEAARILPIGVRLAFTRLGAMLKRLRSFLTGKGYRTWEDVFADARSGRIADRGATQAATMPGNEFAMAFDPVEDIRGGLVGDVSFGAPRRSLAQWLVTGNQSFMGRLKNATSREALSETLDQWRFWFQDSVIDLKKVQREITARLGRPLLESEDAYLAHELFEGRTGPRINRLADEMVNPLMTALRERGITMEALSEFLYARHAPERNAYIASINPKFEDGGSGMSNAQAADIMARVERAGRMDDMMALAGMVDAINDFAIDTRVKAGLMTEDQAIGWRERFPTYVPLRGFEELDGGVDDRPNLGGSGVTVKGAESRTAFGRESRAADIIPHIIMQAQEAIVRAERNRVGQALYELAKAAPNNDFWKTDPVKMKPLFDSKTGQVVYRPVRALTRVEEDHTVSLKIDGKAHRVTFNHNNPRARRLAEGLRKLHGLELGILVRTMGAITRTLSAVNTAYNPEFVITNAFRDVQTAVMNLGQFDMPGLIKGTIRDYRKALVASMKGEWGRESGEWGKWYREFIDAGGRTFWNQAESIDQIKARLQSEARAAGRSAVDPRRWANAVGRTVENVNAGIENAIRLSTYANARKMGLSPARAASIAKNVTVNFSRRGTAGPAMNSLYMFFNASVQGTAALLTSMRSPTVRKRLGYVAAFGAAVTLMNMILDEEDDDGESFYAKISDFDKQRNLIIMLPGTDGQHLKIPLPYGHNVFYGMGRGAIEGVFGRPALEVAGDLGVAAIESFNPVGGASSLLNLIAPTVVDPIVDLSRNRDFADRPIMPDQPAYDTPLPDAQRYWSSVSPIWRTVTEALTDLTGGDQVKPGAIDVSPETLEYMFGVATGAAGTFYARSLNTVLKMADPTSEVTANDIPFFRKVYGSKPAWYDKAAFYERRAEVLAIEDYVKRYAREGDTEAAQREASDNAGLLRMVKPAKTAGKAMSGIRSRRDAARRAYERGQIDRATFQSTMTDLKATEDEIIKTFNKAFLEATAQ